MTAPIVTLMLLVGGVIVWVCPTPLFTLREAMGAVLVFGGGSFVAFLRLLCPAPPVRGPLPVPRSSLPHPSRPLAQSLRARPRIAANDAATRERGPVLGGAAFERACHLLNERGPDQDGEEEV